MNKRDDVAGHSEDVKLFLSVSEQLGAVFAQIASLAESGESHLGVIRDVSQSAALLSDAYMHNLRLKEHLVFPEVQPVSVGALIYDIAATLDPLARQYGVKIDVVDSPRLLPVASDRVIVESALTMLGQVMVLARSQNADSDEVSLRLAAKRTRSGVSTGFYWEGLELSAPALRRACSFGGKSSQSFGELLGGPSAGIVLANTLLGRVSSSLKVSRHNKQTGLSASLPLCDQLRMV